MDMSLLQGAVTSLQVAGNIAKGFLQLKSMAEVQGKVIELQTVILSAQQSALAAQSEQFAMVEQVRSLEEEIARVKAWEGQKQRYKLTQPWEGAFVYALKKSMSRGEPAHWLCTHCYAEGRGSMLQFGYQKDRGSGYFCPAPTCKSMVHYPEYGTPTAMPYAPE